MTIKNIDKFERNNPTISINVYSFKKKSKTVHLLRGTKSVKERHLHLMLLTKETSSETSNTHYCWIKDLSRLVSAQVSKSKRRTYFCDRCLNFFYKQDKLNKHIENCLQQNECAIVMPEENTSTMEFKNYHNQVVTPFVVYADLETLLNKDDSNFTHRGTINNNNNMSRIVLVFI